MIVMHFLEKWFEPIVIIFMLTMIVVLIFADVVARFGFSTSIPMANELARISFVYMVYFGISYAIREKRHMRVSVVVDMLSPKLRRVVNIIADLVFLIYSVAVCWLGIVIANQSLLRGKILNSTEWPLAVLYAAIIFSGALSTLRLIQSIWKIATTDEKPLVVQADV